MPLPSDEKLIQLGNDLIQQFDTIFGLHPGFRPAHAKGVLLTGSFTPSSVEIFLGTHPAALAYVQTPKPSPSSFAKEAYFGVTAFRFTNRDGVIRHGRYRISPAAGIEHLDEAAAKARGANYLFEEITRRVVAGPIRFDIHVQIANDSDIV